MASTTLTISIADLPVALVLDAWDGVSRTAFLERYANFVVSTCPPEYTIVIRSEPGADFIPPIGYQTWQIRTALQDNRISFESFFEKGWVDCTTRQGELVVRPPGEIENFLRVLYAWMCIDRNSLVLHSCGIIRNNRGYAFFGPSGNGKTTTARLSAGHIILSDDMIIVKKSGAKFSVCGTPFRGDLPEAPRSNQCAELAGMFALTKDSQLYVEEIPLYEAVARLVQCVPFVMSQPSNALRVTEICNDLATQVPVRMLHFQRDVSFWEKID